MTKLRLIAFAVGAFVILAAGWALRGWFEDSKDLAAARAIEQSREVMRELASDVANRTEQAIGAIRIENRTIQGQIIREIVEKPVYRGCVLPDDGVRAANDARRGAAAGQSAGAVRSAKPAP